MVKVPSNNKYNLSVCSLELYQITDYIITYFNTVQIIIKNKHTSWKRGGTPKVEAVTVNMLKVLWYAQISSLVHVSLWAQLYQSHRTYHWNCHYSIHCYYLTRRVDKLSTNIVFTVETKTTCLLSFYIIIMIYVSLNKVSQRRTSNITQQASTRK